MRLACSISMILVSAICCGCGGSAGRPSNPILENRQAALKIAESSFAETKSPTYDDYIKIGTARYLVWSIHEARSKYTGSIRKRRREAEKNRLLAEDMKYNVLRPFKAAAGTAQDSSSAISTMLRISQVYGEAGDYSNNFALHKKILREYGDVDAPRILGLGRTPRYYCNYTLANLYRSHGDRCLRPLAIDAYVRAIHAIDKVDQADHPVNNIPAQVLAMLINYEPRMVLPRYQRLLQTRLKSDKPITSLKRVLRENRQNAKTRIRLSVKHADSNGLLVEYEIICPDYHKMMETERKHWEKRRKQWNKGMAPVGVFPEPGHWLRFSTLLATEDLTIPPGVTTTFNESTKTPKLIFDDKGISRGKMILKWSNSPYGKYDFYLTAGFWIPPMKAGNNHPTPSLHPVYVEPVRVVGERKY